MADNKSSEGKVIGGKRACGKSTELIKESHRTGVRILTANKQMAHVLMDESRRMGLDIKPPLTPDVKLDYFGDVKELLVDEVEMVLQKLIGKRVNVMSTSYQLNELPSLRGQSDAPVSKKNNVGQLTITADVSDALKGLKAVQREARKATAALKELEEQQKKINPESTTVIIDGKSIESCPKCGENIPVADIYDGTPVINCKKCGWLAK